MEEGISLTLNVSDLMKDMINDKGYAIRKIPFNEDIDSPEELTAVAIALINKALDVEPDENDEMPPHGSRPIFEHVLECNEGFASDLVMSEAVGKTPNRYQAKIMRPVQPASNKTLVDNSPESRLFRFCEHIVDKELNSGSDVRYIVSEVNIIETEPDGREQPRHHDFAAYSDRELESKPNCSFILPIEKRANLCVWEKTHKLVHAEQRLIKAHIPVEKRYSKLRSMLSDVMDINRLHKEEIFFGTDEYCSFLDNFVHSGAKNRTLLSLFRLHFYVVRDDAVPPTQYTHIPSEVVWDLTRNGVLSQNIFASRAPVPSTAAVKTPAKKKASVAEDEDEDEGGAPKKRGRPPGKKSSK